MTMSYDTFYSKDRKTAEEWQEKNDEVFICEKALSDKDMRAFAYTFGNSSLEEVWHHYYDSEEKYNRLRRIKEKFDPDGLFSADAFSLKPL